MSEGKCGACGSNLILKNRYRVTDVLISREKYQMEKCHLYHAIDIADHKKSKVIKVLYTVNQETITRLEYSADILINHWFEGIPRVDKGGSFHIEFPNDSIPAYCLVMEKIEGINLYKWLNDKKINHSLKSKLLIG
ncbi:MAG: hypothetical protein ACKO3K_03520 [Cuspidothrix sp.]